MHSIKQVLGFIIFALYLALTVVCGRHPVHAGREWTNDALLLQNTVGRDPAVGMKLCNDFLFWRFQIGPQETFNCQTSEYPLFWVSYGFKVSVQTVSHSQWFWLMRVVQRRPGKWAALCKVREWASYSKSAAGEETAANTKISKAKMAFSPGYINLAEALARMPTERMDQIDYCYNFNTGCSP